MCNRNKCMCYIVIINIGRDIWNIQKFVCKRSSQNMMVGSEFLKWMASWLFWVIFKLFSVWLRYLLLGSLFIFDTINYCLLLQFCFCQLGRGVSTLLSWRTNILIHWFCSFHLYLVYSLFWLFFFLLCLLIKV